MMDEYIKRSVLIEALNQVTNDPTCPLNIAADVYQVATEIPAADVAPVRHGGYVWTDENNSDDAECSCCSYQVEHPLFNDFNYCPYCGAKLDAYEYEKTAKRQEETDDGRNG